MARQTVSLNGFSRGTRDIAAIGLAALAALAAEFAALAGCASTSVQYVSTSPGVVLPGCVLVIALE